MDTPEPTFVVIHWCGNIPLRVKRLVNPTATELLTEQMCHSYGKRFTPVQTLTGEYADRLYTMLGQARAGTDDET